MSTAGALDRTRPPLSEELRPLELPLFHRFRLDNGLKLLVAENPKLPEAPSPGRFRAANAGGLAAVARGART